MTPALTARFLTTGPLRKSTFIHIHIYIYIYLKIQALKKKIIDTHTHTHTHTHSITDSMGMNASKLQEIVKDREA